MKKDDYDTLAEAVNGLSAKGFEEGFRIEKNKIVGYLNNTQFAPKDLTIVNTYRFEGMTNPQDSSIVYAIEAQDGTKGTLVMSYSAKHNEGAALIDEIPLKKD